MINEINMLVKDIYSEFGLQSCMCIIFQKLNVCFSEIGENSVSVNVYCGTP